MGSQRGGCSIAALVGPTTDHAALAAARSKEPPALSPPSPYRVHIPDAPLTDDIRQFLRDGAPGTSAQGPARCAGPHWLLGHRLSLRDAQTLRRQLQAIGLPAEVEPDAQGEPPPPRPRR
jgi:hypothetical protein